MTSNTTIGNKRHYIKNIFFNSSYFSTRKQVHPDGYKENAPDVDRSEVQTRSGRNLFDDLNTKDKKWLKIARLYLSRKS